MRAIYGGQVFVSEETLVSGPMPMPGFGSVVNDAQIVYEPLLLNNVGPNDTII